MTTTPSASPKDTLTAVQTGTDKNIASAYANDASADGTNASTNDSTTKAKFHTHEALKFKSEARFELSMKICYILMGSDHSFMIFSILASLL